MPLYQITNDELSPLVSTSFQEENLWERRDLQRLLRANIEVIADDIMVIAEEFGEWSESGRRIDLLAIDKDANLVVIELKRTDDGGHMELQAIRYAAMVANMTWDQAKAAFQKYLTSNSMDLDAESRMCEFLGWDSPREDDFAQNVRIVLASANFSKSVLRVIGLPQMVRNSSSLVNSLGSSPKRLFKNPFSCFGSNCLAIIFLFLSNKNTKGVTTTS